MITKDYRYNCLGHQNLTMTASAQGLTAPGSATHVIVAFEGTAGTRYTMDGTAPSGTNGLLGSAGTSLFIGLNDLSKFQFAQDAAGAKISVAFMQ